MAMTKKEKAEFNAAIRRAETLGALRWTAPIEKDVPIPDMYGKSSSGWNFNIYDFSVRQMWSESVAHGDGPNRKSSISGTPRGISLFSTRLLALQALRHAVECESAEKLRKIDTEIAKEIDRKARQAPSFMAGKDSADSNAVVRR